MKYEQGDNLLCTVDKIIGTIVFVKLPNGQEGTIIFSEIVAGRVKNIRDYAIPKKQIVCKILRIQNDKIHLSLRRVTKSERQKVMEQFKLEKSYKSIFKTILKEKSEEIIQKIKDSNDLIEFIKNVKEDSKILDKYMDKKESEKILEILKAQKKKKAELTKKFTLTTTESDGLDKIKNILKKIKNAQIKYIAAGKYTIKVEAENLKEADLKIQQIGKELENSSEKTNIKFRLLEK